MTPTDRKYILDRLAVLQDPADINMDRKARFVADLIEKTFKLHGNYFEESFDSMVKKARGKK
jgi:hypothetical protein